MASTTPRRSTTRRSTARRTTATETGTGTGTGTGGDATGDARTTRDHVLAATVDAIGDLGFSRASTNEIARRAGVTWGVIQHHFGTRERLLLAVLEDSADQMVAVVDEALERGTVSGDDLEARLDAVAGVIWSYFRRPSFLAAAQIHLELAHAPSVGADTRATVASLERRLATGWSDLLRAAFEPHPVDTEVTLGFFQAARGLAIGLQLGDAFRGGRPPPGRRASSSAGDGDPERRILVDAFASLVRGAAPSAYDPAAR
jgi:AcrR family transcriptional regulator